MSFKKFLLESASSDEARRLGLSYFGFGKYGVDGKVTHYVYEGRLVRFNRDKDIVPSHDSIKKMEDGKRVFEGETRLIETNISRQTAGAIGEHIAVAFLKQTGVPDAKPLNMKTTNFPVDLIGDHICVEVKTGLASNGKSAQQWRATIGQPGKKETEWLKTASKEEKAAWNKKKADAIMARKKKVLKDMTAKYGTKIKAKTLTVIINPDTHMADVFLFEGFHSRIDWKSNETKDAYVGTFSYRGG